MIFRPLTSSSHGNAYIVSDRETRILLECGVSHKRLRELCGFQLSRLDGCLVSHEHKDHSKAVAQVIKDGVAVHMSMGTAEALELPEALVELAQQMEAGIQFSVGSLDILPFGTFHDAKEPLGFVIRSRVDGEICAFATDTVNLPYDFPGVTVLAVEANYQEDILERCEKMPEKIRHRIRCTHMEIDTLCKCLGRMDLSRCRELWLLHLSDATSHEYQFVNKVRRVVPPTVTVRAANR